MKEWKKERNQQSEQIKKEWKNERKKETNKVNK